MFNEALIITITSLTTTVLVKGGDLLLKWLSHNSKDSSIKEKLKRDGYELTILYLDSELKTLRTDQVSLRKELDASRAEHTKCLVENSQTRQVVEYLREELEESRQEIIRLKIQ